MSSNHCLSPTLQLGSAVIVAALLAFSLPAKADQSFDKPENAASALADAVKSGDQSKILSVLGENGKSIVVSGDELEDKKAREQFAAAYDAKHAIERESERKAVLVIGDKDWPFPVPMVEDNGKWRFDAEAGRDELRLRRIGRNELDAMMVARAYVKAQLDYAELDPEKTGRHPYAEAFISSEGKKDGLYWPAKEGEPQSPLGPFLAKAAAERANDKPYPYHGYFYRILTAQGPAAPGGPHDYMVNGQLIGGFALIAYPADYGRSGVMSFMVDHDGVVYQKDLGKSTAEAAMKIHAYLPDAGWEKVSPPASQANND